MPYDCPTLAPATDDGYILEFGKAMQPTQLVRNTHGRNTGDPIRQDGRYGDQLCDNVS
jgi:hypothetical protein